MTGPVISYSEDPALAAELSTAAAALIAARVGGADPVTAAYSVELDEVHPAGATTPNGSLVLVTSAGDRRLSGDVEGTAAALAEVTRQKTSSVILIGATRLGRQVAAKLAVATGRGVLSDVRGLMVEEGRLSGSRAVYAGKFTATVSAGLPCIATLSAGAYEAGGAGSPSSATVGGGAGATAPSSSSTSAPHPAETIALDPFVPRSRRIETRPKVKTDVDLKNATIIVSAGRGFKTKEDLVMVQQLAKALGGAVGASRPLSSDLGWLGEEHHIGLTGIYVHPDLYIAVGISGQLQHIAGIKDSKIIVAINKDKQAPIFQVSDYGVVGDLYQVLPALLKLLGG